MSKIIKENISKKEKIAVLLCSGILNKICINAVLKGTQNNVIRETITSSCSYKKTINNDEIKEFKVEREEAISIAEEMIEKDNLWWTETAEEAFEKGMINYRDIPKMYRSENIKFAALKHDIQVLRDEEIEITDELLNRSLEYHPHEDYTFVLNMKRLSNISEEVLKKLIIANGQNAKLIAPEKWNKEILYFYLEQMVKNTGNGFSTTIGDPNYSVTTIPNELKDKVYWQTYCMVDGYNFCRVPEEYKKYVLTEKLVDYCLSNQKSYVGTMWLMERIPDELKTYEVCLKACVKHFAALQYIPQRYKTEEFYKDVIAHGQTSFEYADMSKIPSTSDIFSMVNAKTGIIKSKKENKEISLYNVRKAGGSGIFKDYVSKRFIHDRELIKEFLTYHGASIDTIDEKDLDEELCIIAMRSNNYVAYKKIPLKYQTDSFWENVIKDHLEYKLNIPEKYITPELIRNKIETDKIKRMDEIPPKYQTKEFATLIANKIINENTSVCISEWNSFGKWADKELASYIINGIMQRENGMWLAVCSLNKGIEVNEDILWELVKNYNILNSIKDPTEEMLDYILEKYPISVFNMPEWYIEKIRKKENIISNQIVEEVLDEPQDEKSSEDSYDEEDEDSYDEEDEEKYEEEDESNELKNEKLQKNTCTTMNWHVNINKEGQITLFDLLACS